MVIQILYGINALDSGGIHFGRLMLMLIDDQLLYDCQLLIRDLLVF